MATTKEEKPEELNTTSTEQKEKITGKKRTKEDDDDQDENNEELKIDDADATEDDDEEEEDSKNDDDDEPKSKKRKTEASSSSAPSTPKKQTSYSFREAAIEVLRRASRPLSAKDITTRMIEEKMITTSGKTPDRTVAALMYSEIKTKGKQSAFRMAARGVFGLTEFTEEQNKNVEGTSTGYMDEDKVKKKKKTSTPQRKRKVTRKSKKEEKEEDNDEEKTEDEDEEEKKEQEEKKPKRRVRSRGKKKAETKEKEGESEEKTENSKEKPASTSKTNYESSDSQQSEGAGSKRKRVVTPIRTAQARPAGGAAQRRNSAGASKVDEDGYNDDYGYMYLRYFLDLTRRQEEEDYSPEDDCFICKNGGDLICCDFPDCSKVYHLSCLKMSKIPDGKWYCPLHFCATCNKESKNGRTAAHHCATCTNAYCEEHLPSEKIKHIRKGFIICQQCMPYFMREIDDENGSA